MLMSNMCSGITTTSNYPQLRDVCEMGCPFPSVLGNKLPLCTLAISAPTFYWLLIRFCFLPKLKTNFKTWFHIVVRWESWLMLPSVKIAVYIDSLTAVSYSLSHTQEGTGNSLLEAVMYNLITISKQPWRWGQCSIALTWTAQTSSVSEAK